MIALLLLGGEYDAKDRRSFIFMSERRHIRLFRAFLTTPKQLLISLLRIPMEMNRVVTITLASLEGRNVKCEILRQARTQVCENGKGHNLEGVRLLYLF